MILIKNAVKTYDKGLPKEVVALNNINIELPDAGFVSIAGKSGCGKTTLLNCLAGLDTLDNGEIIVNGVDLKKLSEKQLEDYRNSCIGIVFQEFNCLDDLTVYQNIELALKLQGKKQCNEDVLKAIKDVGLEGLGDRKISELSGGQKQRVAIARALVKGSQIILADEPTGNLDSDTGVQIFDLLKQISKEKLVIVISHDKENTAIYSDKLIEMKNGKIIADNDLGLPPQITCNKPLKTNIKTHLGFAWIARFGIRLATTKKLRLVLSILLPAVMLAVFGLSLTVLLFSQTKQELNDMYRENISVIRIAKLKQYAKNDYNEMRFSTDEINELSQKHKVFLSQSISISLNPKTDRWTLDDYGRAAENSESIVVYDDTDYHDLGLTKLCGRLPKKDNEIAITDLAYDYYLRYGYYDLDTDTILPITNYQDVCDKVKLEYALNSGGDGSIKSIVGIFKTEYNIDKYYDKDRYNETGEKFYKQGGESSQISLDNTIAGYRIVHYSMPYAKTIDIDGIERQYSNCLIKLNGKYSADNIFGKKIVDGVEYIYAPVTYMTEAYSVHSGIIDAFREGIIYFSIGASVFSGLLIMNFIFVSIELNRKKIGIFCSLGTRRKDINKMFLVESLFILLFTFVLAAFFCGIGAVALNAAIKVTLFPFSALAFFAMLLFGFVITVAMTILPLRKLTKKKTIDIIKT